MPQPPPTRPSLLVRLRDPRDGDAWGQFVDLYAPLVFGWVRVRGLQDADAADLTQEVLRAVAASLPAAGYDPAKGAFRGWLYAVTRNKLNTFLARQGRLVRGSGDPDVQKALEGVSAPDDGEERWRREYEARLIAWAAEQARGDFAEKTWRAFWLTAVEGQSGESAARELGMTAGAVYVARCRVLARLREVVRQALDEGETIGG
jgi:RNA polymerase sigma-70 factor (ECF subfamily)